MAVSSRRPLSDAEQKLADILGALVAAISEVGPAMQGVKQSGGDPREAYLALAGDDARGRAELEMQWPMLSMMLAGLGA